MSKTKITLTLVGFLAAAAMAIPARANGNHENGDHEDHDHPEGHCGGNGKWDLVKVKDAKCEFEAKHTDKDGNHDNFVCEKWNNGHLEYKDNEKHGHDHHHD